MANRDISVRIKAHDDTKTAFNSAKRNAYAYQRQIQAVDKTQRAMGRGLRGSAGQLGHQLQDIAVQAQMGVNPLMILGQQGSQVAAIFGAKGAVVGGILAVGAAIGSVFVPSLFNANEKTDAFNDDIERLNESMARLKKISEEVAGKPGQLITAADLQRVSDFADIVQFDLMQAMSSLAGAIQETFETAAGDGNLSKLQAAMERLGNVDIAKRLDVGPMTPALHTVRMVIKEIGENLKINADEAQRVAVAYGRFLSDESVGNAKALRGQLHAIFNPSDETHEELRNLIVLLDDIIAKGTEAGQAVATPLNPQVRTFARMGDIRSGAEGREAAGTFNRITALMEESRKSAEKKRKEDEKGARVLSELEMRYADYYTAADIAASRQKVAEDQAKKLREGNELQVATMSELEQAYLDFADRGVGALEDSLVGLVNGTMSAKEAFRSMALSIVNDLIRMQMQQSITGPLGDALGAMIGGISARSSAARASARLGLPTLPPQRAVGGPVTGGKPYLVGERGPELMIPNGSGSVMPNNALGGQGVTVVQNINISTGVQQTVRTEVASMMPQIANAAKSAVLDARRRGGSFAGAFG